jgi:hypothetical protein
MGRKLANTDTESKLIPTNSLETRSSDSGLPQPGFGGETQHIELLAATIAAGYASIHMPVDEMAVNAVTVAQDIRREVRRVAGLGVPALAMAAAAKAAKVQRSKEDSWGYVDDESAAADVER